MTTATPTPRRDRLATVVIAFIAARVFVFGLWAAFKLGTQNDVLYYWHRIHLHMTGAPASETLIEYPTPVIWLLEIPYWLALQSRPGFVVAYIIFMLLLDLGFAIALWRAGGTRRSQAVLFWVLFTLMMGPTTYMRFDLIPAVLGGAAVMALLPRQRSRLAGGLIGVGAAIKLWPALLWPATLVGDRPQKVRASIGFWAVGIALALASLLYGGWGRLVSPLTWQSGRGLQIESIWATVPMAIRAFRPDDFLVAVSRWQAFEIAGPGASVMQQLSTIATILGMVVIGIVYWQWLKRRERTVLEAGLMMLLVITVTIVTNKTFSPQYMMWLGGPMAAMIVASGHALRQAQGPGNGTLRQAQGPGSPARDGADTELTWRRIAGLSWWILGLTLATQLVYPIMYEPLVHGGWLMGPATAVLVLRNVAMVVFTGLLLRTVWRSLGSPVIGETRAERRRRLRRTRS
ncbi:MAG TPA: glycosyltransferase family 87 protein [Propionibacteriaceae bacterium]|nr:glycosyltransferase family 87 protein [Propionibacteriaceae bacterium]HQE30747.1 glycosyltransferase family 87 protein [Propionibacteriaceae bacterium]